MSRKRPNEFDDGICELCKGLGRLKCLTCNGKGHFKTGNLGCGPDETCHHCKGRGTIKCGRCNGKGKVKDPIYEIDGNISYNEVTGFCDSLRKFDL